MVRGGVAVPKKRALYCFPKQARLTRTADFGNIARTRGENSFRVFSSFFSAGCLENSSAGCLRFGVTVGKKNAPRSVDRATVKRILREAARHHLPSIRTQFSGADLGMDVALRLKAPLNRIGAITDWRSRKKLLREDAERLFEELVHRIELRRHTQNT